MLRVAVLRKAGTEVWPPPQAEIGRCASFVVGATAAEVLAQATDYRAILWVSGVPAAEVTALVAAAGEVDWVHSFSAGVDSLRSFLEADESKRVALTNGRGAFSNSLAEYVITAALYFTKQIPLSQRNARDARWDQFRMGMLRGQTMGFVGWGHIAKQTARFAQCFGMKIVALRRSPTTTTTDDDDGDGIPVDQTFSPAERTQLFAAADFVVCSLPATPETADFCGPDEFNAMKSTGVFISLGRGAVVDEDALLDALTAGRIRGAALDVFKHEPLPADSALWRVPSDRIYITSHNADLTDDYFDHGWRVWFANFKAKQKHASDGGDVRWETPFDRERGY